MERDQLLASNGEPGSTPRRIGGRFTKKFFLYSLLIGISIWVFVTLYRSGGECNLFSGEWIHDPLGPDYTNGSCNFIDTFQNCLGNGRPDTLFLYWRWKPYGCDIPPFNATRFMNAMRDKSWAFIGDSILRNHVQSLICLVSKVEEPTEVYHDVAFQTRTWYFSSHNLTLALIWSPFLVESENSEKTASAPVQLHIDALDKNWTSVYHKHDYIVIAGGQWFLKTMILQENGNIIGCHGCDNYEDLGLDYPYRKSLQLTLNFIATSNHKPLVIFRTWNPSHFENGEWFSGGVCNRTLPYKEGEFSGTSTDNLMYRVEVEEVEKAAAVGLKNGVRMKLLDIYHLSLLRPDGHPGPYRHLHPFSKGKSTKVQNDCLHWCLPGPIDHWSSMVMEMVITEGELKKTT